MHLSEKYTGSIRRQTRAMLLMFILVPSAFGQPRNAAPTPAPSSIPTGLYLTDEQFQNLRCRGNTDPQLCRSMLSFNNRFCQEMQRAKETCRAVCGTCIPYCDDQPLCGSDQYEWPMCNDMGLSGEEPSGMYRQCNNCTDCAQLGELGVTHFIDQFCTNYTDAVCKNITECTPSEYEIAAPTASSDRQCTPCTECEPGYYDHVQCMGTQDAQCRECQAGDIIFLLDSSQSMWPKGRKMKEFMNIIASEVNTDDPTGEGYTRFGAATFWMENNQPRANAEFEIGDYNDINAAINSLDIGTQNLDSELETDDIIAALNSEVMYQSFLSRLPVYDDTNVSSGDPIHAVILITDSDSPNVTEGFLASNESSLQIFGCGSQLVQREDGTVDCINANTDSDDSCPVNSISGVQSNTCALWDLYRSRRVAVFVLSLENYYNPVSLSRYFDVYEPWQAAAGQVLKACDEGSSCSIEKNGGWVVPYLLDPAIYASNFTRTRCSRSPTTQTTTGTTTETTTGTTTETTTGTTTETTTPPDCRGYIPFTATASNSGLVSGAGFRSTDTFGIYGPIFEFPVTAVAGTTTLEVKLGTTATGTCNVQRNIGCGTVRDNINVQANVTNSVVLLETQIVRDEMTAQDDDQRVRIAAMLRTPYNPLSDTQITFRMTDQSSDIQQQLSAFTCRTNQHGYCVGTSALVPSSWWQNANFNGASFASFVASATGATSGTERLVLFGRATPLPTNAFSSAFPIETLFSGDAIDIEVQANFLYQLRTMNFLVTTTSPNIIFNRVNQVLDSSTGWLGSVNLLLGGTQLQIVVTRSSYSTDIQTQPETLFTIRGQVIRDVASIGATLNIQCIRATDVGGQPVSSTSVTATDRQGSRNNGSGRIFIDRDLRGFFVSTLYPELVNRAIFDGVQVNGELNFWRVRRTGTVQSDNRNSYSCSSDTSILSSSGCSIRLLGTESRGDNGVIVSVTRGTYTSRAQLFKVWYPQTDNLGFLGRLTASNAQLKQILGIVDCSNQPKYQRARMFMSTQFTAGSDTLEANINFDRLESSSLEIARVVSHPSLQEDMIQGVGDGTATISAYSPSGLLLASMNITVAGITQPSCLHVTPFRGLDISIGNIVPGVSTTGAVEVYQHDLDEIGQRVHFVASVLFDDDMQIDLLPSEITITSNAPDTLAISSTNNQPYAEVVEPGLPDSGNLVTASWINRPSSWENSNDCISNGQSLLETGVELTVATAAAIGVRVQFVPIGASSPVGLQSTTGPTYPFIVYNEQSTTSTGEVTAASIRVWIEYEGGGSYEFSTSPLLDIVGVSSLPQNQEADSMITLTRANNNSRYILSSGTSFVPGLRSFLVRFTHDNITTAFNMSVTKFEDIVATSNHWPCQHSPRRSANQLQQIDGPTSTRFQSANLAASHITLVGKPGVRLTRIDQGALSFLFLEDGSSGPYTTTLQPATWVFGTVTNTQYILRPLIQNLRVRVKVSLYGNESILPIQIESLSTTISFAGLSNFRVYSMSGASARCSQIDGSSDDALCGIPGLATADVSFDATLSDSSICRSVFMGTYSSVSGCSWRPDFSGADVFPNYFTFSGDSPASVGINTTTGSLVLLANQLDPAVLTVETQGSSPRSTTARIYANIDPLFADVDIGNRCRRALPEVSVGDEFLVPVRMNLIDQSRSYNIESFNIEFEFDDGIILPVGVGPEFSQDGEAIVETASFNSVSATAPSGKLVVDGGLLVAKPASSAVLLFTLRFRAIQSGTSPFTGRLLMAFDDSGNGLPGNTPFFAGNLTQIVSSRRRWQRQESTMSSSPLLVTCLAITCSTFCGSSYSPGCGWAVKNGIGICENENNLTSYVVGQGSGCPAPSEAPISSSPTTTYPTVAPTPMFDPMLTQCWSIRCSEDCYVDPLLGLNCGWHEKNGYHICDVVHSKTVDGRLLPMTGDCTTLSPTYAPTSAPVLGCYPEDSANVPDNWYNYTEPSEYPPVVDPTIVEAFIDSRISGIELGCPQYVPPLIKSDGTPICTLATTCNSNAPWQSEQERGDVDGDCCFTTKDAGMLTSHIRSAQLIENFVANRCVPADRSPARECSPGASTNSLCRRCGIDSCSEVQKAVRVEYLIRNSDVSARWADGSNDGIQIQEEDTLFLTRVGARAMLLFDPPEIIPASNDSNCQVEIASAAFSRHVDVGGVIPATLDRDNKFVVLFRVSFLSNDNINAFTPHVFTDHEEHSGDLIESNPVVHGPEIVLLAERKEMNGNTVYFANFSTDLNNSDIRVTADVGFWGEQPLPSGANKLLSNWELNSVLGSNPTAAEIEQAKYNFNISFPCPTNTCTGRTRAQMTVRVANSTGSTGQATLHCWDPCDIYAQCATLLHPHLCQEYNVTETAETPNTTAADVTTTTTSGLI